MTATVHTVKKELEKIEEKANPKGETIVVWKDNETNTIHHEGKSYSEKEFQEFVNSHNFSKVLILVWSEKLRSGVESHG